MELRAGAKLHGFTVRYSQELPEVKGVLYRMEYDKNGADLVWLDRADDNKTFCIAFKTIPQDDTGVFHILEHSVLNGSEKYPVKEPFVELLKSSLQTFLNAITYPDKTVYPVCSRNDQDFLNLMDVYLDAVLHPLSASDPHAYRQEGWHYELDSPDGELTCNGVVLNEMKGAYADPDTLADAGLMGLLFPDNCYGYESGGHPDHVPELTYENYLASYHRFYHPSNSRIFLDGDMDLDAVLAKLDSFLKDFDRIDPDADIPMQSPVAPAERAEFYEIGPGEDREDKVLLSAGWVFGDWSEREKVYAADVLADALCGSNEAPLKKALLEAGLCQDVSMSVTSGIQQNLVDLLVRNTGLDKKDQVWATVRRVLEEQAAGLDHDRLRALLNRQEFAVREKDFGTAPRGLVYALNSLDAWLYGGDPAQPLRDGELFASLREKVDQGWFEAFLREVFLDNPHQARLCLIPSRTAGEEKRQAERARLAAVKAGWSEEERKKVVDDFKALRARQERPDGPEELASLPRLALSDIPAACKPLPYWTGELEGRALLHQDVDTDGILYLDLHFDVSDLPLTELVKLPLLGALLGQLATAKYGVLELQSRIESGLGRFAVAPASYARAGQTGRATPLVTVSAALLEHRKGEARELISEVLRHTRFDAAQVYNLLRQARISREQAVLGRGDVFAALHGSAAWSARGAVDDAFQGVAQLRWLQKAEREFETNGTALCGELSALCEKLFVKERVTVSLTGRMDKSWLRDVLSDLPAGGMGAPAVYLPAVHAAEGYSISADIGFAARCGNLTALGEKPTGTALVAAQLITLDYLWDEVRVKGGAYGTGLRIRDDGDVFFTSYRDPRCGRSLETFTGAGAALRAFCGSGEAPDKYIISTVSNLEPVVTPRMEGVRAAAMHFTGRTQADRQRQRDEVLGTTLDGLRAFSGILDQVCETASICVVGGQEALDGCGEKLEKREPLQM